MAATRADTSTVNRVSTKPMIRVETQFLRCS